MKEIPIIFHAGIGSLHIRMPRQQIEETINRLHTKLSLQRDSRVLIAKDLEEDGYTRYQDDAFFFMIKYEKDSAIEICVHRALRDGNHAIVTLGEVDAFVHHAKQLITEVENGFHPFPADAIWMSGLELTMSLPISVFDCGVRMAPMNMAVSI